MSGERRLYIPDLHFPFSDWRKINEIVKFNRTFRAHRVFQLGDIFDFYALSRFVKDPMAKSISDEVFSAKRDLQKFAKMFDHVTVIQGNHEERLWSRANDGGIPRFALRSLTEIMNFPANITYVPHDHFEVQKGTLIVHGHKTNTKAGRAHVNYYMKNVVHGHVHNQLCLDFVSAMDGDLWGMSLPSVVDGNAMAFRYHKPELKNLKTGFGYEAGGKPFIERL